MWEWKWINWANQWKNELNELNVWIEEFYEREEQTEIEVKKMVNWMIILKDFVFIMALKRMQNEKWNCEIRFNQVHFLGHYSLSNCSLVIING